MVLSDSLDKLICPYWTGLCEDFDNLCLNITLIHLKFTLDFISNIIIFDIKVTISSIITNYYNTYLGVISEWEKVL